MPQPTKSGHPRKKSQVGPLIANWPGHAVFWSWLKRRIPRDCCSPVPGQSTGNSPPRSPESAKSTWAPLKPPMCAPATDKQNERPNSCSRYMASNTDLNQSLRACLRIDQERKYPHILPIRDDSGTVRLDVSTIDWIDAAGDYMCVHADGRTYVLRETMKSLEAVLDPKIFQRVHRSTIVNVQRVRRLRPHTNGEYFLTLDDGQEIKLSRSYRDRVDQLLQRR